jgi:hypothetical protein
MGNELTLRQSRALGKFEGQAILDMHRAQHEGAVRTARGIAKAQTVEMVGRSVIHTYGELAIEVEAVAERSPWAAQGAIDRLKRLGWALDDVVDDLRRPA